MRRTSPSGPPTASSVFASSAKHPRDHRPVVEPDHELGAHLHAALESLDDAHDVGLRLARRHEVDDADPARVGLPLALEDQRVVAVAAIGRRPRALGASSQRPCSLPPSSAPKHELESKRGNGSQSTEPLPPDERRGLQVAEERVVLDPLGHG